ncbi:hypothetical protein L195_g002405 [Trifolium pratense]|uniref:Uncharacterized protein n=1 Tax=Trifolium pratense TaxID=57577 RepID=A0A2K3NSD0_TRIPR|nr:hypothetical protein L195_g002405 [Trifolium pratense]
MWQTTGGLFFNYKISAQVFRKQESCCWSKGMPLVKVASYFPVIWSLYLEKVKAPDWSSLVQQEEEERIIYYESAGICSSIDGYLSGPEDTCDDEVPMMMTCYVISVRTD